MRLAIFAAAVVGIFVHAANAQNAVPSADEAIVNLLLGKCLSKKTDTSLPPDSIDPNLTGTFVPEENRDPRLSAQALRIPTQTGAVFYDLDDTYCYVHASGIDAASVTVRLQEAVSTLNSEAVKYEDGIGRDKTGIMKRALVYGMQTPANDPSMPIVIIYYPVESPTTLTAGIVIGQKQ